MGGYPLIPEVEGEIQGGPIVTGFMWHHSHWTDFEVSMDLIFCVTPIYDSGISTFYFVCLSMKERSRLWRG